MRIAWRLATRFGPNESANETQIPNEQKGETMRISMLIAAVLVWIGPDLKAEESGGAPFPAPRDQTELDFRIGELHRRYEPSLPAPLQDAGEAGDHKKAAAQWKPDLDESAWRPISAQNAPQIPNTVKIKIINNQ